MLARASAVENDMSGETSDMNAHHALARWQETSPIIMRPGWSPRLTKSGLSFGFQTTWWFSCVGPCVTFSGVPHHSLRTAAAPCSWFPSSRGRCHQSLAYPGRRCGSWELPLSWRGFRWTARLKRRQQRPVSAFKYYAHCSIDSKPLSNMTSALEACPFGN